LIFDFCNNICQERTHASQQLSFESHQQLRGLWKGIIKPVALAGLVFSALAGFVHWIMVGPNEVQPEG
jgi:uncharacterized protein (DUF2062 family)